MTHWNCCTTTTPTARKEHHCSGCHATIRPGDSYTLTSGLYDDEWARRKDCGRCVPIDGRSGWWATPEDILARCEKYHWWDGMVITQDAVDRYGGEIAKPTQYEAAMVPLVGLMDWVEVAP